MTHLNETMTKFENIEDVELRMRDQITETFEVVTDKMQSQKKWV